MYHKHNYNYLQHPMNNLI